MTTGERPPGTTWSGNYQYQALRTLLPSTTAELEHIVRTEDAISVQGTRHTFSAVSDTNGVLVSLEQMPTRITHHEDRVRVEGHVTFAALTPQPRSGGRFRPVFRCGSKAAQS